jgi:hypothetical protein
MGEDDGMPLPTGICLRAQALCIGMVICMDVIATLVGTGMGMGAAIAMRIAVCDMGIVAA